MKPNCPARIQQNFSSKDGRIWLPSLVFTCHIFTPKRMTPSNFNWNCTKAELHYKYLAFELVHEKNRTQYILFSGSRQPETDLETQP